MLLTRRFLGLLFLLGSTALVLSAVGCGRQKEGERCLSTNGDADCDANDNLVCTPFSSLRGNEEEVDRCCPPPGIQPSDARCAPRTSPGDGDGDGDGDTGIGGIGGGDGSGEVLGGACEYNSDCAIHLICGSDWTCIPECKKDRDCPTGFVCTKEQTCE